MAQLFYSTVIGQGENKSFIQSGTGENYCGAWAERESERKGERVRCNVLLKWGFGVSHKFDHWLNFSDLRDD